MEKEYGAFIVRRIIEKAYAEGWSDACGDHMQQRGDATYAIGTGRRSGADHILARLDPQNMLGLRMDATR